MFAQRSGFFVVGTIALLSACSNGASDSSDTATETAAVVATTDSTIVDSTTASTLLDTTTTSPTSLDLHEGGLGFFDFGAEPEAVIDGVNALLGTPISDTLRDYPSSDGNGLFVTDSFSFIRPSGRSVCWSVGLCVSFGGVDATNQRFTGWSYWDDPTSALSATSYGLTLGSRLNVLDPTYLKVCDNGTGGLDGLTYLDENLPVIEVRLRSEGVPFTLDGNLPGPIPPADQVIIIAMSAGHNPNDLASDCRNDRLAR
ncbi:MAG: hypothetical protein K8R99_01365 [Actinomycetia bacterium]|nr:hypothetical protein [Actinomycetes bacterium]